jgi:membrane protein YqaA with SNARE-associated domain
MVATVGNALGGLGAWWFGFVARNSFKAMMDEPSSGRLKRWLSSWGPKLLLLSWLLGLGDPLCLAAGWLKLPWRPCLIYMLIGKLLRYVIFTWLLTKVLDSFGTSWGAGCILSEPRIL